MTIHYATGGLITPEKSEFSTLCHRKFPRGGSDIMQSGYTGAQNTTCKDCRKILDEDRAAQVFLEKLEKLVRRAYGDRELCRKLEYAITIVGKLN